MQPILDLPVIPEFITVHLGPARPAGGEHPRLFRGLHQKRGLQRNLSHLAGIRHPCQYPGTDQLRPQPDLHRILPQPRL